MYIGLISDTHGKFCQDVKDFLSPVDQIWHAGDFGSLELIEEIRAFKPLVGVWGNIDGQDIRKEFKRFEIFECEGIRILMTHIGLKRGSYWAFNPGKPIYDTYAKTLIDTYHPDIFVFGHSHIPQVMTDKFYKMLIMNPGACGLEGPTEVPRMALRFHLDNGQIHGLEKCEFTKNFGR
ncbi:MAG: metallophosphatase family protein [Bacteroidales bacterium]|nr:metallophosphatase family protein [Bacteroidales bacterium]